MFSTSKSKVYFFFENIKYSVRDSTRLKKLVKYIFSNEKKQLKEMNYVFCSDRKLKSLNKKYLGRTYSTDIITFRLSANSDMAIIGEAYISLERVKKNAFELHASTASELARVIIHGALHLCGYNDKTEKELSKMRKKEDLYLSLLKK